MRHGCLEAVSGFILRGIGMTDAAIAANGERPLPSTAD
jgi:hypothetical protein